MLVPASHVSSLFFVPFEQLSCYHGHMLTDQELEKLRRLLAEQHQWPSDYIFKFIVPQDRVKDVEETLPGHNIKKRASRQGKFIGLTVRIHMESADVVIAVYHRPPESPDSCRCKMT